MASGYVKADSSARPQPILDAFKSVGVALAGLGGVVTTLVTLGVISSEQGDAVNGVLDYAITSSDVVGSVVAGAVAVGAALLASFGTGKSAQGRVTPVEDPRAMDGTPLTKAIDTPPQP